MRIKLKSLVSPFIAALIVVTLIFSINYGHKQSISPTNAVCTKTALDKYIYKNGCVTK